MKSTAEIRLGRSGGLIWPTDFRPGLEKPESVCRRQPPVDVDEDDPDRGAYGFLPAEEETRLDWLELHDLADVIRFELPRQLNKDYSWFCGQEEGTAIPWDLLRTYLSEAYSEKEVRKTVSLQGSRVCGLRLAGTQFILLGHASGAARESPTLTVLKQSNSISGTELVARCKADSIRHPIQEVRFSACRGAFQGQELNSMPLLASRSWYWVSIFRPKAEQTAEVPEGGGTAPASKTRAGQLEWTLEPVSSLQLSSRVTHISWNPRMHAELAFATEDGTIGFVNAEHSAPGTKNGLNPRFLKSAHAGESQAEVKGLEWANHPRLLFYGQAQKLRRVDFRDARQPPRVEAVHSRPDDDVILAIRRPDQSSNYLALCTSKSVCLLDVRRPQQAVLQWKHEFLPTPLVSFQLSAAPTAETSPAHAAPEGVGGCISLANLSSGDNLAFRFTVVRDGARLQAHQADTTEHPVGEQSGSRARISVEPIYGPAKPSDSGRDSTQEGFSWVPLLCDRIYSLDMPQRLVLPLTERRDEEARQFGACDETRIEEREILAHAPDIQGWATVPGCPVSAHGDSLTARIDLLGNIHLDSSSLFRTSPPLPLWALPPRRQLLAGAHEAAADTPQGTSQGGPLGVGADSRSKAKSSLPQERRAEPQGELSAIPKLLGECMDRWKALQLTGAVNKQLSLQERDWLLEIVEEMQVPMTAAEVERSLRIRASAAAAGPEGFDIARPTTVQTAARVPSQQRDSILAGRRQLVNFAPRHSKTPPGSEELQFWPGAWHLEQLTRAAGEGDVFRTEAVQAAVEGSVRVSGPMSNIQLPGVSEQRMSQPLGAVQDAMEDLHPFGETRQTVRPRAGQERQVPFDSSFGGQRILFPAGADPEDMGIPDFEPASQEAAAALEELEEAWRSSHEGLGTAAGGSQPAQGSGYQETAWPPQGSAPRRSLLGSPKAGDRRERKRKKQIVEGFS